MADQYSDTYDAPQAAPATPSAGLSQAVRRKLHACVVVELPVLFLAVRSPECPLQLRRFCQSSEPGAQKVGQEGIPVYYHGRWSVSSVLGQSIMNTGPLLIRCSYHSLGESGLGKSTLINTLFNTTLYAPKEPLPPSADRPKTVSIESISAGMLYHQALKASTQAPCINAAQIDIEENGVRLRLTVVDTPGFGDFVNNEER